MSSASALLRPFVSVDLSPVLSVVSAGTGEAATLAGTPPRGVARPETMSSHVESLCCACAGFMLEAELATEAGRVDPEVGERPYERAMAFFKLAGRVESKSAMYCSSLGL